MKTIGPLEILVIARMRYGQSQIELSSRKIGMNRIVLRYKRQEIRVQETRRHYAKMQTLPTRIHIIQEVKLGLRNGRQITKNGIKEK
jgi:hypothetical protein